MPRLSVLHLLIWITVSAVLLSITRAKGFTPPAELESAIAYAIMSSAITVAAIVLSTCVRDGRWQAIQPGHWFAFIGTWEQIDNIAVTPVCLWLLPNHMGLVYCIAFVGMAIGYLAGAVVGPWQWYWRISLGLHAMDSLSAASWRVSQEWGGWPGVSQIIRGTVQPAIGGAAILFTVASISLDLYRRQRRDSLHWIGMAWPIFRWQGEIRAYVLPVIFSEIHRWLL